jgi:hypothetical protein
MEEADNSSDFVRVFGDESCKIEFTMIAERYLSS